jgi:hypothetical protein
MKCLCHIPYANNNRPVIHKWCVSKCNSYRQVPKPVDACEASQTEFHVTFKQRGIGEEKGTKRWAPCVNS